MTRELPETFSYGFSPVVMLASCLIGVLVQGVFHAHLYRRIVGVEISALRYKCAWKIRWTSTPRRKLQNPLAHSTAIIRAENCRLLWRIAVLSTEGHAQSDRRGDGQRSVSLRLLRVTWGILS